MEFTSLSPSSSIPEGIENITVKIEPESLIFPDEQSEAEKAIDDLNIDQNPNRQNGGTLNLMYVNIKEEHQQIDENHDEQNEQLVEFGTSVKEERYSSEGDVISQRKDVENVEYLYSECEYKYGEGENLKCSVEFEDNKNIHIGFFENYIPGISGSEEKSLIEENQESSVSPEFHLKQNKKNNRETSENRRNECEICSKKFTSIPHLKRHINDVHNKLKNYECQICNNKFSNSYRLKLHLNAVHNKLKKYECQHCNTKFSYMHLLKEHVNVIHKGIKDYECEECGKKFCRLQVIKKHINRVHLGVKNFKCQICNKLFSELRNLKTHNITVHMKIKNYHCQHCDKSFFQSRSLKWHNSKNHA